jgi:hypothetical protein
MQGVMVESTWMFGIIAFMVLLGMVACIGALKKRNRSLRQQRDGGADNRSERRGTGLRHPSAWEGPGPSA